MIAHYADVARAFVEVATPWAVVFVVAMTIAAAPDLMTRYRIWRHRIFTARGMR